MNSLNISENKLTLWTLYLKICNTFLNVPTLQLYSLIQHNIKMFRKKTEIAHLNISDNWLIKSHWTFSSDILSIIIPGTVISWSPHRSRHWFSHIHNITNSPQHFYGVLCFYGWFLSSFPNPFEAPSNKVILTAVKLLMPFAARLSFVFVIGNPSSPVPLGQSPAIWRQNIIKHIKSTVFQLHDKTSNLQFLKSTVTTYISLLQQPVLDLSIVR